MIHRTPDIREWSARAGDGSVAQRHLSVQSAEEDTSTLDTAGVKVQASRQVQTLLSGDATHPTQVGTYTVNIDIINSSSNLHTIYYL